MFSDLPSDKTTFLVCDDYSSLKNTSPLQSRYDELVNNTYKNIIVSHEYLKEKYSNSTFFPNCISDTHFKCMMRTGAQLEYLESVGPHASSTQRAPES